MKTTIRLFVILALAAAIIGCVSTESKSSGYTKWEGDFGYQLINGVVQNYGVMIIKYRGKSKDVNIPQTIQELPVTYIHRDTFAGMKLTSVTIAEGITAINAEAFRSLQLTSITIPNSVTSIGERAFAGNQLTSVTIPARVRSISSGAFVNNPLTNVTMTGVYVIDSNAFANNRSLTSVTFPSDVTVRINMFAFDNTPLLRYINAYGGNGTYEIKDNKCYHNGTELAVPANLFRQTSIWGDKNGVQIHSIDGKSIDDLKKNENGSIAANYFLAPGLHTLEVSYYSQVGSYYVGIQSTIWSEGTTTISYVFESGGVYDLNAITGVDTIRYEISKR